MRRPVISRPCSSSSRVSLKTAAWRHLDARVGFEVVFLRATTRRLSARGALDGGRGREGLGDPLRAHRRRGAGSTRSAYIVGRSALGVRRGAGSRETGPVAWWVDGERAPHLDGCLEVDLEASAFTNALPVHRLGLDVGRRADAPAAYVRARRPPCGAARTELPALTGRRRALALRLRITRLQLPRGARLRRVRARARLSRYRGPGASPT